MATRVIFLTSGTTWTVPQDWSPSNNTIEAIGGGGGGGASSTVGGGGGGAYTKLTNFFFYPGQVVNISIGNGGNAGSNGTDTWLNKINNAAPTSAADGLLAKAGLTSTTSAGGLGGTAASCVPSASAFSGGAGGAFVIAGSYPAGGGAGGPDGAGGAGGVGYTVGGSGGGGGGGNNGSAGNTGTASAGGAGGAGGGTSGGAGGNGGASGVNAGIGKTGTGGGGGGGARDVSGGSRAAPGGSGNYWTATSTTSQTVTISQASPGICTVTTAPQQGTPVVFTTTGTLPSGLTAGTTYYVLSIYTSAIVSTTTFNVSATLDGTAIPTTSAGSGTHTATFTAIAGSGGGAGGGSSTNSGGSTTVGGGGLYGAGGGNSNNNQPTVYGLGAKGIIVITYTPPSYASRLTNTGNLYLPGYIDEVTNNPTTFGSLSFSGTTQYLTSTATYTITTGNYTIECWAYGVSTGASQQGIVTLTNTTSSGLGGISIYVSATNAINFFVNGSGGGKIVTSSNGVFLPNVWNHVALVGNGGTNTLYVNGVSVGNNSLTPTVSSYPVGVGRQYNDNTAQTWSGYISNLRIVIGTAVYTGNFTPPTQTLPSISNTQFLLNTPYLLSSAFTDSSPNNITLTNTGPVTSIKQTPFVASGPNISVQRVTTTTNAQVQTGALQVTGIFDEVTINNSGVAQRLYPTGNLQIGGIFDEVTRPT